MSRIAGVTISVWLLVATATSAQIAPFAQHDATVLAIELSDSLLAPPALTARIGRDLEAIRAFDPRMASVHVYPDWLLGALLVGLEEDAFADLLSGRFAALDSLNAVYGADNVEEFSSGGYLYLTFNRPYNPKALASLYAALAGVRYAEPNGMIGDGNDLYSTAVGTYTFKVAWGEDCLCGCSYVHFWTYRVTAAAVTLVAEWGTPTGVQATTWGQLKAALEDQAD
jgi:hypothetical protein